MSVDGLGLTRREREIVQMIAEGMTTGEVAAELVLSHYTVRTHVRNAMRKLDVSTRTRAAVLVALDEAGVGLKERSRAGV